MGPQNRYFLDFVAFSEGNISNQQAVPKYLFGYNDRETQPVPKNVIIRLGTGC